MDDDTSGGLISGRRDIRPGSDPAAFSDGWRMSPMAYVQLAVALDRGPLPFAATVAGFVAAGADLVDLGYDADQDPGPGRHTGGAGRGGPNKPAPRWSLGLEAPGAWFATLAGHRLPNHRGPHLWVLPPVGESTA